MIESRWHRRREPAVARRSRRCNARRLFLWERASGAQSRIGINSGYCNVGNFGSADRIDYTIIGAEANLAARLQSIAEPGGIVISYETFALVRDVISAHSLPPITMKGISREVIPYSVDGMMDISSEKGSVVVERMPGLEFYLDPSIVRSTDAERIRSMLLCALSSLDNRQVKPAI